MEILITLVIVVLLVTALYWLAGKLPPPLNLWAQIVVVAGGFIWLLTHVSAIIHAIANAGK